ncbi:hypothetical protein [Clostridium sp.]|uniref:hypothetical protein n=1 Tax=Clostridium sp. TaxID=1506 RepID=UPI0032174F06
MKFKDSPISIKKVIILAIISIFVGSGIGIMESIPKDEFSKINEKNEVVLAQISDEENILEESKGYLNTLASKEAEFKNKKEEILKAEREAKAEQERIAKAEAERVAATNAASQNNVNNSNSVVNPEPVGKMVWKTATGKKYHSINNCGNTNPKKATCITMEAAESQGLTPCSNCY